MRSVDAAVKAPVAAGLKAPIGAGLKAPVAPAVGILLLVVLLFGTAPPPAAAQEAVLESFRAQIALESAGSPRISPDGSMIAFSVTTTDWEANRFDQEIWLVTGDDEPFQLTRTESGNSTGHRWSPDGSRLGFIADRGDGAQIYLIRP